MPNLSRATGGWSALLTLSLATSVHAASPFDTPVDPALLDRVRGGSSLSFDIQQSVYVNGVLTATSGVRVAQDATGVSAQGSSPILVQLGGGNTAPTGLAAATAVVQNSLDNQKIRTVTTIDVSAQILGAYRSMHLQSMLTGAITGSLRR